MSKKPSLLAQAWEGRDKLYRELFGDFSLVSPNHYAPPVGVGHQTGPTDIGGLADPGDEDQRLTILSYAPDPLRPYWMHVTAGLSNPWHQEAPAEVSGFGCEIMIKTPTEALWAARILRTMAFYVFNHATTLSPGAKIALNGPISITSESDIRNLIIWYADDAPDCWYQLPSGGFGIFTAIGITQDECQLVESIEQHGTWCLQEILRQAGVGQITDAARGSIMSKPELRSVIESIKSYAANFPDKPSIEE